MYIYIYAYISYPSLMVNGCTFEKINLPVSPLTNKEKCQNASIELLRQYPEKEAFALPRGMLNGSTMEGMAMDRDKRNLKILDATTVGEVSQVKKPLLVYENGTSHQSSCTCTSL